MRVICIERFIPTVLAAFGDSMFSVRMARRNRLRSGTAVHDD